MNSYASVWRPLRVSQLQVDNCLAIFTGGPIRNDSRMELAERGSLATCPVRVSNIVLIFFADEVAVQSIYINTLVIKYGLWSR